MVLVEEWHTKTKAERFLTQAALEKKRLRHGPLVSAAPGMRSPPPTHTHTSLSQRLLLACQQPTVCGVCAERHPIPCPVDQSERPGHRCKACHTSLACLGSLEDADFFGAEQGILECLVPEHLIQ